MICDVLLRLFFFVLGYIRGRDTLNGMNVESCVECERERDIQDRQTDRDTHTRRERESIKYCHC